METIQYNGIWFPENVNINVMDICSKANRDTRYRFWFGDVATGKSWEEENDVCGYIGRSTGWKKIPLLIQKRSSSGGGALLTDCIIKIQETVSKRIVYQHPTFSQAFYISAANKVFQDFRLYATCKKYASAKRLADFMNGKRMSK